MRVFCLILAILGFGLLLAFALLDLEARSVLNIGLLCICTANLLNLREVKKSK